MGFDNIFLRFSDRGFIGSSLGVYVVFLDLIVLSFLFLYGLFFCDLTGVDVCFPGRELGHDWKNGVKL